MTNTTIDKIKQLLADIDDSLEDEDKITMVRNLWEVGRLATGRKDATGKILKEIAAELDVALWALQRYTQFYRSFAKGYPERYDNKVITWSMFCEVLPVHDAAALEQAGPWENTRLTIDKNWCIERLQEKIRALDWNKAKDDIRAFIHPGELPSLELWGKDFFLDRLNKYRS